MFGFIKQYFEPYFERLIPEAILVNRVAGLSGTVEIDPTECEEILSRYGISISSRHLLQDLSLLALGGELKNRYEVEADVKFRLTRLMPWFLRFVPGLTAAVETRMRRLNTREWVILKTLKKVGLPGFTFENHFVSACLLYFYIRIAIRRYGCSLENVEQVLETICELARTATENERDLLSTLPRNEEIAELPEFLQKQFDKANEDREFFFSGDDFKAHYSLGKAVRALVGTRSREVKDSLAHVAFLEELLSHPARGLILSTSRRLSEFQAFVMEKLTHFTPDPYGDEMRMRPIRELSEIKYLSGSALAYLANVPELFWVKATQGGFDIREYGFVEQERPRAHVLIDKSLSMLFFGRLFKATGVLFNRMLMTMSDDADITVQFFDEHTEDRKSIESPHQAQQIMNTIRMKRFIGAAVTDIDGTIEQAVRNVRKLPDRTHPCLLYTSPSPRDATLSRMPSSA